MQGKTVVAHNESFDRTVLQQTMSLYGLGYAELNLSERWECTMQICRKSNKYPYRNRFEHWIAQIGRIIRSVFFQSFFKIFLFHYFPIMFNLF